MLKYNSIPGTNGNDPNQVVLQDYVPPTHPQQLQQLQQSPEFSQGLNQIPHSEGKQQFQTIPIYEIPKTKIQLEELLFIYERLRLNFNNEEAQTPTNPLELKAIEKVLYQVSEIQKKYLEEESKLLIEIEEAIKSEPENEKQGDDENLLEKQIAALQLLSKDLDVPESLQYDFDISLKSPKNTDDEGAEDFDKDLIKVDYSDSLIFDSFEMRADSLNIDKTYSKGTQDQLFAPLGNFFTEQSISSKIQSRISELENLPSNIGTFNFSSAFDKNSIKNLDELKIRTLIELKSLRVLAKQKQLRKIIIFGSAAKAHYEVEELKNFAITLLAQRSMYIRPKIIQQDSQHLAERLEERKELEAKKIEHELHVEKVQQILLLSDEILSKKVGRATRRSNFGKFIGNYHATTEKDESKKLEKTARQRLQALKANDEEAYIKLLDQTKDHRITHLLKQTNTFLDSLAQAVKAQQVEQGAEIPLENVEDTKPKEDENGDSVEELREKIDYYKVAHTIQEEIKEQPGILVGGKLKEYQLKGLQWMVSLYNNKLNGILADEMGLGKTIQSISLVTHLIEKKGESKFLVLVPLSTITNWTLEFEKWAPSVKVIVYKGSPQQRRLMQNDIRIGNFQVLLTTYEYVIRERPLLCKFNYSHMIIDEGHRMKNATSKLSITLKQYYKTKNRLILTGTPLQNNLPELWALLNFVLPKVFNSVKSFDEWFNTPFANTGSQEKIELTEEESLLVIRRLHKVLRPFLLRRLKKDVEKDLPDKVEKVVKCKLSGLQYILYQQMLKHNALFVGEGQSSTGVLKSGIKGLNNKIMQLRKICNHPFVFEEVENVLNLSRLTNDLIWRTSGKFELLDRVLPKFKKTGHRVLMFFQMTQVMDIMEDFLRWRDMKYLRLDGSTKADERQDMLKVFNKPNSDYFCFLLSTRAGGLGLNLQTADTVIIFDTDWNPHQDLQAQDRAHRIGQKNEVRILRLITNDSVEEVILERAHQKLDIDGKVIQAGKFDNKSTAEEQEDFLRKLLDAESNKGENEENDSLDDEELNEILARLEDEKVIFAEMDADRLAHEKIDAKNGGWSNRLISKDELPPVFEEDISRHFHRETKELGKMREKKRVKYDDGLTEEQWLMAMDDDEDTVEDAIRRKEERMAKRKRNTAKKFDGDNSEDDDEDDNDDDDEDEDEDEPRSKRSRRSKSPAASKSREPDDELLEKGGNLLDEICKLTAPSDGHNISEIFLDLPARKIYPDYYKIIRKPVSINQLRKKLRQGKIDSFEELIDELKVMCENARTYNEEGSWVYVDSETLEGFVDLAK